MESASGIIGLRVHDGDHLGDLPCVGKEVGGHSEVLSDEAMFK